MSTNDPLGPMPDQSPTPDPEHIRQPFWKKKHAIIPAAVAALFVVIAVVTGQAAGRGPAGGTEAAAASTPSASASTSHTTYKPTSTPSRTPTPTPTPTRTKLVPQHYTGVGADVITLTHPITSAAVVTFNCPACSSNTVLKSDGRESLLVNEIGTYSGSRLINVRDNSMTTEFEVRATGAWTLDIGDLLDLTPSVGKASGSGDAVLVFFGPYSATKAEITNVGKSNFAVKAYSSEISSPLLVNEIGSYRGTVKFGVPAIVEVTSSGDWTIDPK